MCQSSDFWIPIMPIMLLLTHRKIILMFRQIQNGELANHECRYYLVPISKNCQRRLICFTWYGKLLNQLAGNSNYVFFQVKHFFMRQIYFFDVLATKNALKTDVITKNIYWKQKDWFLVVVHSYQEHCLVLKARLQIFFLIIALRNHCIYH